MNDRTLAIHVSNEQEFNELMKIYDDKGIIYDTRNPFRATLLKYNPEWPVIEFKNDFDRLDADSDYHPSNIEVISFQEFIARWLAEMKDSLIKAIDESPDEAWESKDTLEEVLERMPEYVDLRKMWVGAEK